MPPVTAPPTGGARSSGEPAAALLVLVLSLSLFFRATQLVTLAPLCFSFIAITIAQLIYRPGWRDVALSVGVGSLVGLIYFATNGNSGDFEGVNVLVPGAFIGCGSLIVALYRRMAEKTPPPEVTRLFWISIMIPAATIISGLGAKLTTQWIALTWDQALYCIDRKMGVDAFIAGQWLGWSTPLRTLCVLVYNSLPLNVAVCIILWSLRFPDRRFELWHKVVLLAALGFTCYQIVPACGPVFRYQDLFPWRPPAPAGLSLAPLPLPGFPRNALPSLHFGWMLLCFWNSRVLGWPVRVLAGFFMLTTGLATVGLGEHYVIDLVVAFPVCAIAHAMSASPRSRRWIMASGTALALVWIVGLRNPAVLLSRSTPALQAAAFVTIVLSAVLASVTNRQQDRRPQAEPAAVAATVRA